MEFYELVIDMKLLERRLTLFEEKYGVLSEDFYAALMSGKLARYDEYEETRADFSRWKGIYKTWQRRKQAYHQKMNQSESSVKYSTVKVWPKGSGSDAQGSGKTVGQTYEVSKTS